MTARHRPLRLTVRQKLRGEHVEVTILMGPQGGTAANVGTLTMTPAEAVAFAETLHYGAGVGRAFRTVVVETSR